MDDTNQSNAEKPAQPATDSSVSISTEPTLSPLPQISPSNQSPVTDQTWKTPPDSNSAVPEPSLSSSKTPSSSPNTVPSPVPAVKPPILATTTAPTPPLPAPPVQQMHPPRHGSPMRWVVMLVVLFFALAFILVGLVFADDKGIVSTGISSDLSFLHLTGLTGGLSVNPAEASAQVAKAMQGRTTYAYAGNLTGYGKSSSTCADQTSCVATNAAIVDPLSLDTQFQLNIANHNYALQSTINDAGVAIKSEYRVVDGALYIMNTFGVGAASTASGTPSASSPTWVKSGTAPSFTVDTVNSRIGTMLGTSSYFGRESIAGTETYHYRATISGKDLPILTAFAQSPIAAAWQSSNGPIDLWISRSAHLLTKLTVTLTNATKQSITINATLANQQVGEITVPDGAVDVSAALTPDQMRKSDLSVIAASLAKYFKDKGVYPLAASIVHTDQVNSAINTALVPVYLDKMPSDPSGSHYYGYVSDGSTYQLSAVLDNAADPDGTVSGPLTLYLLKSPLVDSAAPKQ